MIKKLVIKNFQCHKSLSLDFSEGFNVITGSSDNGKSAIVRALCWALFNTPTGFSFKTEGAKKDTVVEVHTNKGVLRRVRGEKENYYELDGEQFKALKGNVPVEVTSFFNIPEESVQNQFDPHFMFHMSPGEVARMFNEKAPGLKDIDPLFSSANKFVSEIESDLSSKKTRALKLKDEIEELSWIKPFAVELKDLTAMKETYDGFVNTQGELSEILDRVEQLDEILSRTPDFDELGKSLESVKEGQEAVDAMKDNQTQVQALSRIIQGIQGELEELSCITALSKEIQTLEGLVSELSNLRSEYTELAQDLSNREKTMDWIEEEKVKISGLEKRKKETAEEEEVCPTCGRPLE